METRELDSLQESNLREQTAKGVAWVFLAQFGRQGFQFITSIILARILLPSDLGLIGMIVVFTGFAVVIGDLGFSAALIQREKIEPRHLTAVYWLNIASGIVLTVIFYVVAPLIADFYAEPRLNLITKLASISFLVTSFTMTQKALLSRRMNFRLISIIEIVSVFIAGIIAIVMAFFGFGVWSLVWQTVLVSLFSSLLLWWAVAWRPTLSFDKTAVQELFGYSGNLMGFNVFNYWSRNADNLLIGRFLGAAALGIYSTAYSFMLLPLSQVTRMISRVMFPTLSRVQKDKVRVKRIYLQAVSAIALFTFPLMIGLLVVAKDFVLAIYGEKWIDLIRPLQILSLVGMYQSVGATVGWIYQSQGRTDLMFRWGLFAGLAGIGSFVIGIYFGTVEAVAISYALLNALLVFWLINIPGKLIDLNFGEVVTSLSGVFICAATMGLLVFIMGLIIPNAWNHLVRLMVQIVTGVAAYIGALYLGKVDIYKQVWRIFMEQYQGAKSFSRKTYAVETSETF